MSSVAVQREALLAASRCGDVVELLALLDVRDELANQAAQTAAASAGQAGSVEAMLEAGVAPSGKALAAAVEHGHGDVVALLVAAGAPTGDLGRALGVLSAQGNEKAVARMLAVDVVGLGHAYFTALQQVSASGHDAVVALLLPACRAVAARGSGGGGHEDANYNDRIDERALTRALDDASKFGHANVVALLLAHGVSPHSPSRALGEAAARGHADVCALLLAAPAGPPARGIVAQALVLAAWHGSVAVVDLLLAAGNADVHWDQDEALQIAARNGHVDVVARLVAAGAAVQGRPGSFAVTEASWRGDFVMVAWLVRAGASASSIVWAQLSPSVWPSVLQCVPSSAFATLPTPTLQAAWLRYRLRPQLRLRRRLDAVRARLDRPPREPLGSEPPTRETLIAHLATGGRRFAREYWLEGLPIFFPGRDFGPVPSCFTYP